jgi:hypothetical protein
MPIGGGRLSNAKRAFIAGFRWLVSCRAQALALVPLIMPPFCAEIPDAVEVAARKDGGGIVII